MKRFRPTRHRLTLVFAVAMCMGIVCTCHGAGTAITDLNIRRVQVTDLVTIPGCAIEVLRYAPDSSTLACGTSTGQITLFSMANDGLHHTLLSEGASVTSLDFSPDGRLLVAADAAGAVTVWSWKSGEKVWSSSDTGPVYEAGFSPTGDYLVVVGEPGIVRIWATDTWEPLPSIEGHTGPVYAFAISPEEDLIVTGAGDDDPSIRLWTFPEGEFLGSDLYEGRVQDIEYSPRDRHVAISGTQLTVWLWEVDRLEFLHLIFGVGGSVPDIAYSSRGTALLTVSTGGTLCYHRVPDVTPKRTIRFERPLTAVDFAPNRATIACGDEVGRVYVLAIP